jgi:dienelactone hydrolase
MTRLSGDDLALDVAAALDYLRSRTPDPPLVVGFSMGGYLAALAAARHDLAGAVAVSPAGVRRPPWAGLPPVELLVAERRCPWLGVVGGRDHLVDADLLAMAARTEGPRAEVAVLPDAGHGFYRAGHPAYDDEATTETWRRIRCFLGIKSCS